MKMVKKTLKASLWPYQFFEILEIPDFQTLRHKGCGFR